MKACEDLEGGWELPHASGESMKALMEAMDQAGWSSIWTGLKKVKFNSFYWETGPEESKMGIWLLYFIFTGLDSPNSIFRRFYAL